MQTNDAIINGFIELFNKIKTVDTAAIEQLSLEEKATLIRKLTISFEQQERYDLLLKAIGVPMVEQLRTEAARGNLHKLLITREGRFFLVKGRDREKTELNLTPVHKAVYLLFLNHVEGIEFKHLQDYRDELEENYKLFANRINEDLIHETVDRLTNPCDNAINEKCSRIKEEFLSHVDEYSARYYIISGHKKKHIGDSQRVWFERTKIITLPRELVINELSEDN